MIEYNTGTPGEVGVYACRVRDPYTPVLWTDMFLMWMDKRWWYLRSDQQFRGEVEYFIGPLQRKMK